jgi:hypothetical protein
MTHREAESMTTSLGVNICDYGVAFLWEEMVAFVRSIRLFAPQEGGIALALRGKGCPVLEAVNKFLSDCSKRETVLRQAQHEREMLTDSGGSSVRPEPFDLAQDRLVEGWTEGFSTASEGCRGDYCINQHRRKKGRSGSAHVLIKH